MDQELPTPEVENNVVPPLPDEAPIVAPLEAVPAPMHVEKILLGLSGVFVVLAVIFAMLIMRGKKNTEIDTGSPFPSVTPTEFPIVTAGPSTSPTATPKATPTPKPSPTPTPTPKPTPTPISYEDYTKKYVFAVDGQTGYISNVWGVHNDTVVMVTVRENTLSGQGSNNEVSGPDKTRGFVGFDIAPVVSEVKAAKFHAAYVLFFVNAYKPSSAFQDGHEICLQHVDFGSTLEAEDYDKTALDTTRSCNSGSYGIEPTINGKTGRMFVQFDVSDTFKDDIEKRTSTQYRLVSSEEGRVNFTNYFEMTFGGADPEVSPVLRVEYLK